jgi:hypothetical protein
VSNLENQSDRSHDLWIFFFVNTNLILTAYYLSLTHLSIFHYFVSSFLHSNIYIFFFGLFLTYFPPLFSFFLQSYTNPSPSCLNPFLIPLCLIYVLFPEPFSRCPTFPWTLEIYFLLWTTLLGLLFLPLSHKPFLLLYIFLTPYPLLFSHVSPLVSCNSTLSWIIRSLRTLR